MAAHPGTRTDRAAFLLGFALGGFFDGILLHQVLQWHHLLSGVRDPRVQDVRVQMLADGLFHLLMYVVALAGAWLLWREARRRTPRSIDGGRLLAVAAVGFGAWHTLDAVASHWLLGIHRIRMDSAVPLAWDLGWLVPFGLLPAALGLAWLRRHPPGPGRGHPDHPGGTGPGDPHDRRPLRIAGLLVGATLVAGIVAARPPAGGPTIVVFRPGTTSTEIFAGIAAVRGGLAWVDRTGTLWAVDLPPGAAAATLYRHGALLVTRSPAVAGCAAWARGAERRGPTGYRLQATGYSPE